MPPPLQPVRGTSDLIGDAAARHTHIVETARRITALYGFSEWQTPIFESTAVFARTLGETSDVVTKEMYTFADRGGDSITLRPEGTAGICRALITAGLTQTLPQKVFYQGPMFRYERPQKGRSRQFHQIGIELLSGQTAPAADAEVIACGWHFLKELKIENQVKVEINTLGDAESRANYRVALVEYFKNHEKALSEDSKIRLEKNPLRILDSKDDGDKNLIVNAPIMFEKLSHSANQHYEILKSALAAFGVPFTENPRIVRGLDYYNHTAFEFVTTALGAQGTVLAGGRYDGLVEQMGGPTVPGVGWAAGIERLAMLIAAPERRKAPVAVINMTGEDEKDKSVFKILKFLRESDIAAEAAYSGSVKKRLELANRSGASFAILVGPEISNDIIKLKNLTDGSQDEISVENLITRLRA